LVKSTSLNPIVALDHVIEEYRDRLQSEFRPREGALRGTLETELDRPALSRSGTILPSPSPLPGHGPGVFAPVFASAFVGLWRDKLLRRGERLRPPATVWQASGLRGEAADELCRCRMTYYCVGEIFCRRPLLFFHPVLRARPSARQTGWKKKRELFLGAIPGAAASRLRSDASARQVGLSPG